MPHRSFYTIYKDTHFYPKNKCFTERMRQSPPPLQISFPHNNIIQQHNPADFAKQQSFCNFAFDIQLKT